MVLCSTLQPCFKKVSHRWTARPNQQRFEHRGHQQGQPRHQQQQQQQQQEEETSGEVTVPRGTDDRSIVLLLCSGGCIGGVGVGVVVDPAACL
jgi:hypothetical protein